MKHANVQHAGRPLRRLVVAAALCLTSACLMHRSAPGDGADRSVITADEIATAHVTNAYDAVLKLRPRFLTSRGRISLAADAPPALPNVYVDDMYYGDASTLRGISALSIESITFLSAAEAQYRFGRGNMAGAIAIVTKH